MDCPPGQKKSGHCGEVVTSGGSTVILFFQMCQFQPFF